MVDLQQKNPYPTLFSYNNYKEPLNSRSGAAINKRAWIIHNRQKKRGKPEWDRLWNQWCTFLMVFLMNTLNKKLVRICCVNFLYLTMCHHFFLLCQRIGYILIIIISIQCCLVNQINHSHAMHAWKIILQFLYISIFFAEMWNC